MRTLLAVVLALWCGIVEAAVFNNSFTTNSPGKYFRPRPTTTSPLFPLMSLNPSGVGGDLDLQYSAGFFMSNNLAYFPVGATSGYVFTVDSAGKATWQPGIAAGSTGTVNTLPKWTSTNALGDSRVLDDGAVLSVGGNGAVLTGITNSTDVVGIGDFALDTLVGDGLLNIYAIGPSALAGTTLAPFSSQIFAYGESALSGATITNATHLYMFGESSGVSMTGDGPSDIYAVGKSTLDAAQVDSTSEVYLFGDNSAAQASLLGAGGIYTFGSQTLRSSVVTNSTDIYAIGPNAMNTATLVGSDHLYAIGSSTLSFAALTNSTDIYAFGEQAGAALAGSFQHVFLIGSGATATGNNQWVAGDSAYVYRFPGVQATFGGFVALSGTTNQLTDDGSTLLRNGVAIAGTADTTWSNRATLTMTGTNVSAVDFSLIQGGGSFKLVLTGNAYFGSPTGVSSSIQQKGRIWIQQPSTGTCLVKFTNGAPGYAWPEGVSPVVDTNGGAVSYIDLWNDPFTNGILHGTVVPFSKLATNL